MRPNVSIIYLDIQTENINLEFIINFIYTQVIRSVQGVSKKG